MKPGNIDLNYSNAKGIYAFIQVGKESFTMFNGLAGYLYPLHALGNYDFEYDLSKVKSDDNLIKEFSELGELENTDVKSVDKIIVKSENANPFTGYNIIMSPAYNIIEPNVLNGTINIYDEIFRNEIIIPSAVELNGKILPSSDFELPTYPFAGTKYDAFIQGNKIGIGYNPAPVSVLTYFTQSSNGIRPSSNPQNYDNRKIYLSGLSIEVLEQRTNGDIKVKIRWDDYDINSDVRWCGPIVLNENIYLKSGKTITLDQGLTPTKPINPMIFNGEKIFADYTVLTCKNSSLLKMEINSSFFIKSNSALVLESGSNLEINDGAIMVVKSGSTLQLKNGSSIIIKNTGKIEVEEGGYICIESGANINLQDNLSVINLRTGYNPGVNTNVIANSPICLSSPATAIVSGSGTINSQYYEDTYVQNETITSDRYITGRNIFVGSAVTTSLPQGVVIINNGVKIILDAEYDVVLDDGFEVELGGDFEIK